MPNVGNVLNSDFYLIVYVFFFIGTLVGFLVICRPRQHLCELLNKISQVLGQKTITIMVLSLVYFCSVSFICNIQNSKTLEILK